METTKIDIKKIAQNTGQIAGLPANPRQWKKADVERLAKSIEETPELLEARPIIVMPHEGKYIVLGGNLRLAALKHLGRKDVPVYVLPEDTPIDKQKEIVIKDNGSFGEWDYDELANQWDDLPLADWGVPSWETETEEVANVTEDDFDEDMDKDSEYGLKLKFPSIEQRKEWEEEAELQGVKICRGLNWGRGEESEHRCDLLPREKRYKLKDFYYISCFHNTTTGERLSIIKQQQANIKIFADAAVEQIKKLNITGECTLVSAPARKHIENNFAENICEKIAQDLCLNYERGIIMILSKDRFRPIFSLKHPVKTECVILYDDIITTGKTIAEMKRLFDDKEVFVIIGIENDHPFKD